MNRPRIASMIDPARYRRKLLYTALVLALALLVLDRAAAYLHRPAADSRAVVIYTTAWCPYCKRLRAYLDERHIPYTDYDVEHSLNGGLGFWALRGRGVPVSVVGPDIIHGFDFGRIRASLAKLGYENAGLPDEGEAARAGAVSGGVFP